MFESFEPGKTEKAKCPHKKKKKNSTLHKTMPQAAGKKWHKTKVHTNLKTNSGTVFHTFWHGVIHSVASIVPRDHFISGWSSPTAN